jgi:hypothetical protein
MAIGIGRRQFIFRARQRGSVAARGAGAAHQQIVRQSVVSEHEG